MEIIDRMLSKLYSEEERLLQIDKNGYAITIIRLLIEDANEVKRGF